VCLQVGKRCAFNKVATMQRWASDRARHVDTLRASTDNCTEFGSRYIGMSLCIVRIRPLKNKTIGDSPDVFQST
jgi:hypothetical protein